MISSLALTSACIVRAESIQLLVRYRYVLLSYMFTHYHLGLLVEAFALLLRPWSRQCHSRLTIFNGFRV